MNFGPFVLLSLFYAVVGVRVVVQLARRWRETFDQRFTPADRMLVDQSAFFVLVPISVALHEFGHAIAIWLLGGQVHGWGYYGFAGYVGFDPAEFTRPERILIASAGTIVNILLAAGALALVFGHRPPMRAAFNELLLQFTLLSLINALVIYPLLDLFSGLNGDWSQMYRGGVPALSAAILVIHAGILGLILWAWRSDGVRARLAGLTGAPPGLRRVALGAPRQPGPLTSALAPAGVEATLQDAARRVASGWPLPIEAAIQHRPEGTLLVLSWHGGGFLRAVMALAPDRGGVELTGAMSADDVSTTRRPLGREPSQLDADRLTLALRVAMETVDTWSTAPHALGS
jgi:hypothetical protein